MPPTRGPAPLASLLDRARTLLDSRLSLLGDLQSHRIRLAASRSHQSLLRRLGLFVLCDRRKSARISSGLLAHSDHQLFLKHLIS